MGRKPKLTEAQQAEARKRRAEGATLAELARSYHVGKSTISRLTGEGKCSHVYHESQA
jgi:DNA invertase Pin-like site-specific DNA recombinase